MGGFPRRYTFPDGRSVCRLGYGAMRLTGQPGNFGPYADPQGGRRLLQRARALGIDHIDTARAYGPLDNERLIAEAIGDDEGAFVATKGGLEKTMGPDGMKVRRNGGPDALATHLAESADALARRPIDLYYLHFPDPEVPLEQSVKALADQMASGNVLRIGLSNVSLDELKCAQDVVQIDAVQNRLSGESTPDADVMDMIQLCAETNVAFVPHGPLGANPTKTGSRVSARDGFEQLLSLGDHILLIPGTTSIAHLEENVTAFEDLTMP